MNQESLICLTKRTTDIEWKRKCVRTMMKRTRKQTKSSKEERKKRQQTKIIYIFLLFLLLLLLLPLFRFIACSIYCAYARMNICIHTYCYKHTQIEEDRDSGDLMCRIIFFLPFFLVVAVYCYFIVVQTCPFFHLRFEERKKKKSRPSNKILLWQSVCAREIEHK